MAWQAGDYTTEGAKPFDQGSFGTVWRARRVSDGIPVALKLVLLTDAEDARDRIAAERHGAMLQQQFHRAHGMVPAVYGFGQDADGHLYIAMELIEGGALSDLVRQGPLPARTAAAHAVRICEFLETAHDFATSVEGEPYDRLVHADLKPGHVLIGPDGAIKVLDFGIAKALARTTQVTTNNWGTSAYASPERLEHGHVNEHVDFWSLGVILYEMVAGHRPYPSLDRNRSQLEHAIRTNQPREPLPLDCPPDLAAIIGKLLAYQVDRRYASAADIKADLERFLCGQTPLATSEYVTPPTMPIGTTTSRRPPVPRAAVTVPPTDPLPVTPAIGPAAAAAAPSVAPPSPVRPRRFGRALRRLALAAAIILGISTVSREGVAWVAAERFRDGISSVDRRSLDAAMSDYDRIRGLSVFGAGLHMRVDRRLRDHLVALAQTVIEDYRREEPTLGAAEWKQAQSALQWAFELQGPDRELLARLRTCEAHVIRLSARGQSQAAARITYRRAVDRFRDAAALDDRSPDPYLGISRVAVYGLDDLDQAAEAIKAAEARGYVSGKRERALMGDGYLRRANAGRLLAHRLSGEQRQRELERSRSDFEGCIEAFDPIVDYGFAAKNLEVCKANLERVRDELARLEDADGSLP
jgi:hypothetical protein